ncbi:DsbA family oxidoreductase [Pontibacter akesuensis]|uniref:Predicted dithiol-disulfide isomerase, DsbA family n=1 Tax=Pontibacter akesuensis TaxID=388950 RepID=A0A1I7J1A5_9BACT|nr:DsbA family oxidoreductase [Pontibacter akesuensis]GHA73054.1 2-hydroxychromene-2-carboxylate isomerase [Pontibacter akesuensis]SFU78937.1 Predicted dithiol-disulfide isomerase, DsbA family [Pontibacter akesuensis]
MLKIKVYSDYVCPYCFYGEVVLERALKGLEDKVEVEWMPFELRPYPTPTLKPEEDYLQTTWKNSVYPMGKQLDVHMVLPKVSPQPHTHLAFEGYQFAKEKGLGEAYTHRMFTAFFQEEQDLGDKAVLANLAQEVGLDAVEFAKALDSGKYKQAHLDALKHAYEEVGVSAVPTFIIGNKKLRGLLREEDLRKLIEQELG